MKTRFGGASPAVSRPNLRAVEPAAGLARAPAPRQFSFALVENFSMMSIAAAIEPLRAANRLLGRTVYSWRLVSVDGASVPASNGLHIAVHGALTDPCDTDILFVCAGLCVDPQHQNRFTIALRNALGRGGGIGAISAGAFVLARAGVLDGHRCTLHWEYRSSFTEKYPHIDCTDALYEVDRNRYTCSGGVASMDLMLSLITADQGAGLSEAVANQFHLERIRTPLDPQRSGGVSHLAHAPAALRRAVALMLGAIETPVPIPAIARQVGLTSRQLERLFGKHLGDTPVRYYLGLRMTRGRELLLHSSMSIMEIALATGFASSSYFSRSYRAHFGLTPSEARAERG